MTIVEFSDFECPFCKQANTTMTSVMEKVFGKGEARLSRLSPREHSSASTARRGGRALRTRRRKVLGVPRRAVRPVPETRTGRSETLRESGRDSTWANSMPAWQAARTTHPCRRTSTKATSWASPARRCSIINGRSVRGAQRIEAFARVIDDELARTTASAGDQGAIAVARPFRRTSDQRTWRSRQPLVRCSNVPSQSSGRGVSRRLAHRSRMIRDGTSVGHSATHCAKDSAASSQRWRR